MSWLLPVLIACQSPPALPEHTAPVRLVQVFDDTHWVQAPPATPAPTRIFHDGFEEDALDAWASRRTDRSALSRVEQASEGQWALALSAGDGRETLPPLTRRIPVQGDRTYTFSAKVQTHGLGAPGRDSEGATIALVEHTHDGIMLRHDTQERLRGDTPWRTLATTFHTHADTRELELRLVPATGATGGRVLFDDVSVVRLDPLAEMDRLPAWTEHARPTPHPHVNGVNLGPDFRPAITHATPASWGFAVDVPDGGADLRFAWALGAGGPDQTRICFSVAWADRPVGAELWQHCTKGAQGRRWIDVTVPLDRDGPLVFAATSSNPGRVGHAMWADVRVQTRTPVELPNVAIIVLDTLRADHVGAWGYTDRPTTPALDAFAARAVRYSNARSSSPWTAPSLGSVVTGRTPSEHRAGTRVLREMEVTKTSAGQKRKNQLNYTGMSLEHVTLGELLSAAGYETVGFQTNYFYSPPMGFARGFGRTIQYKGSSLQGARMGLDLIRDWLTARDDERPFLLSAHFIDPHMPYRMRRPYTVGFTPPEDLPGVDPDPQKSALLLREFTEENRPRTEDIETLYDADIRWLDDALGELMPLLEQRDTLVVVLSDHGEAFDEHGNYSHGHGLYDELLQVPLLIRLPGGERAGTVDDRQASLLDVLPTLLARTGLPAPAGLPGQDLLAVPTPRAAPLVLEAMYSGRDRTGLLDGDWKYIYTHPRGYLGFHRGGVKSSGGAHNAREALFDLVHDPGEQHDLSAEQPERVAAMRDQVHQRLQHTWPGLHLRCEGVEGVVTLTATETLGQISPFSVESTDRIVLDRTRHQVELTLGDDADWLALRFLQQGAAVTLTGTTASAGGVAGTSWTLGTGELPTVPPPAPGTGCQVWEVPLVGDGAQDVDDETFAELEALGYVE